MAVELSGDLPCVAAHVDVEGVVCSGNDAAAHGVCVAAVHLPTGNRVGLRTKYLKGVVDACGGISGSDRRMFLLGDMNAAEDEVQSVCKKLDLRDARYAGYSWGLRWNRFDAENSYPGPGLRKDRVLFGAEVWAEAHLLAQGRVFVDGCGFCLSDHFGLLS